jgi:hypothetical protein
MTALIVALKKAAFLLLTDKRVRTGVLSVIVGIIGVILVMFGTLFTLSTVEIEHRKEIIDYIFNENIPVESILNDFPHYYTHITESRKYLKPIAEEAEVINEGLAEENSLDVLKIRVIYCILFLENALQPDIEEGETQSETEPSSAPETSEDIPTETLPEPPLELENLPDTSEYASCFYEQGGEEIEPIKDGNIYYTNLEILT